MAPEEEAQVEFKPLVTLEMDSLPQIKSLVARGSGYTIISPAAVIDLVEDGKLLGSPIRGPRLSRKIYLVRSAVNRITAACRATEECCREVVGKRRLSPTLFD